MTQFNEAVGRIRGDLKQRTLGFGVKVVRAIRQLPNEPAGWLVAKQLGGAGTSIGANVWESDAALTDAEFASKMSIARKEANETEYWVELSRQTALLSETGCAELRSEVQELVRILGTIVLRTQEHIRNK